MNIAGLFLKTVSKRGQQIAAFACQARESDNPEPWKQLKRIFHSLKSSAVMAGFQDLSQLAELAEKATDHHVAQFEITKIAALLHHGAEYPDVLNSHNPIFHNLKNNLTRELNRSLSLKNGSEIQ